MQVFVEVAGNPFQIGPAPAKALDASRIEIDADKSARRQHAFAFEHVERQKPGGAHQLAPIATQTAKRSIVLPEQMGRFTQDAEIPVPALRFGGIVEGVVFAVGEIGHDEPNLKFRSYFVISIAPQSRLLKMMVAGKALSE